MRKEDRIKLIKEMLKDDEFLCGGIYSKEKQAMKKYNISQKEMDDIMTNLYFAVFGR